MRGSILVASVAGAAAAFAPAAAGRPALSVAKHSGFARTSALKANEMPNYADYMQARNGIASGDMAPQAFVGEPEGGAFAGGARTAELAVASKTAVALHPWQGDGTADRLSFAAGDRITVLEEREPDGWWMGELNGKRGWFPSAFCRIEAAGAPAVAPAPAPKVEKDWFSALRNDNNGVQDDKPDYERMPWWEQIAKGSEYTENQRKDRRTVFMHDDWVRHRSSERFFRNMKTIGSSGINQNLFSEITFVTMVSIFVVISNMLLVSYQDFGGVVHPGPLNFLDTNLKAISLPALPFSVMMPALSLLLVFRTNTAYFRWNEARTLWGGLINNCRNVVRQCNTFFPDDPYHQNLKKRMAAETQCFIRALRNFLRGPSDDDTLRKELYELVDEGLMTRDQADAVMAASNRPMFSLQAMSTTLRKAQIPDIDRSRIDSTISVLVDLTGANERIFKSPIPLVYTRLTARFLTVFLTLLPLALWGVLGDSWNHWATIPATLSISFFLFGIEEVGIQIEEPFSILPLEAFCNGAITATMEEMLGAVKSGVFDKEDPQVPKA